MRLTLLLDYTLGVNTHATPTLLLVEDDAELTSMVVRLIEREAIKVQCAANLALARRALAQSAFDAVILDIMLPDGNGLDLCREIRHHHPALPVLMFSARGDAIDRVLGLEMGADDYLPKPFDAAELIARLRALLRRGKLTRYNSKSERVFDSLKINLLSRTATINESPLQLSSTEYKLLLALCEAPGVPSSREDLSRAVQPGNYMPSDRSVDVQITRLRKKLSEADSNHTWITTVRGEGYVLTLPTKNPAPT